MYRFVKDVIVGVDEYIENHTHINYCEVIILPNGDVCEIKPSHLYTLIRLAGETTDTVYGMIPVISAPLNWLIEYTGCACVWYESIMAPYDVKSKQIETIKKLVNKGILKNDVKLYGSGLNEEEMKSILEAKEKRNSEKGEYCSDNK